MESPLATEHETKTHFRFEGRVIPELRKVTIPQISPIQYSDPWGFHGDIYITIVDGRVEIDCVCFDAEPRTDMCIERSFECATALVDLYAFTKGWSLSVVRDRMIVGTTVRPLAISELSLQPLASSIASDDDFRAVWKQLLKAFNLKFALHDLVTSIGSLNYPHIGATRSVEAIRRLIAPDAQNENMAWSKMRSLLNIERVYLQQITDASRDPRHGNRGGVTGEGQLVVMQRAWTIMNRYLEFMKRGGGEPLPQNEFPVLSD
jgi:hypothetical protein